MIDQNTINKIKDSANVVDVMGDFVKLKKKGSGGSYSCLCPFHDDRHEGSFVVSESRNVYTCFSCGAHGGPVDFLMNYQHLSFADSIKWLGAKYGIPVEGSENFKVTPCKPHKPLPPLPMLTLNKNMVKTLKARNGEDVLCKWLRNLPWSEEQSRRVEKMIGNYQVGAGKEGHTVFWQIDEEGNVRTGKMMLYKPDGHRDRTSKGNFNYVHSILEKNGIFDRSLNDVVTCFFGQHLMDLCPNAIINLVESEKTALICAIAYGDMQRNLWLATGGMHFLTKSRLEPFIKRGRTIIVYPDHDGINAWKAQVKSIDYDHMKVNETFMKENWTPEDGEKADIADIILRIMRSNNKTTIEKFKEKSDAFAMLCEKFDLIEDNEKPF